MPVPFQLRRDRTLAPPGDITVIREIVEGTLAFDGRRVLVRWWIGRVTDRLGRDIRAGSESAPRREAVVPLDQLARADLTRDPWWRRPRRTRLALEAKDTAGFAALAGPDGLIDADPARLTLLIAPRDRDAGRDLAAEIGIAIGDLALRRVESPEDSGA